MTKPDDLDFELEITKTSLAHSGGTWVRGTVNGEYRFDALVFAEHAENPAWELGASRISKLWIARLSNKETTYNWDRGLDLPAASQKTQRVVDFLCAALAECIYQE
jgi:hypothetical protein